MEMIGNQGNINQELQKFLLPPISCLGSVMLLFLKCGWFLDDQFSSYHYILFLLEHCHALPKHENNQLNLYWN